MTVDITMNKSLYNVLKLDEEIKAILFSKVSGISTQGNKIIVHFLVAPTQQEIDAVAQIIDDHDYTQLTASQIAEIAENQVSTSADTLAANIPGWATWTEQETLDYITNNVTDLASAKVVLLAMARLLVALRNKTWPNLQE